MTSAVDKPESLLSLVGKGVRSRIAKFAQYNAASPTNTTTIGGRIGSNTNSTFAGIQRVGMNWTAEDVFKNCSLASAYIGCRINYCSSLMMYRPNTGDETIDAELQEYLQGDDGLSGVFGNMGVDCSMEDAFSRAADLETPIRGDAGLIWYRDETRLRLMEFSADQLGEVYGFVMPRTTSLTRTESGALKECAGRDLVYYAGRYFRGCDCVAYKIYERTDSWYANPTIYDACDVIYFRDPSSFRGVRGVTKFATAIQHMEKGETLFQTGMDAALRQSKTAMMIYNDMGAPQPRSYSSVQHLDGQVTYRERIPGGPLTEYFYTGDTAQFTAPDSPGPELIQGVETSDERVALALWMNYAFLISATKVGGAPSRLEIEKAEKELTRIQNKIHRPRLGKVKYTVIMDAVARGLFPAIPTITRGTWQLPLPPSVDAFYDAKENIAMIRAGLESPQEVIGETNRNWQDVLRKSRQWAVATAKAVEDANKELQRDGYKPTVTAADIAQVSDNPQQSAQAEQLALGEPAQQAAKLSAFIGDIHVSDLPEATQSDIAKILGTNGETGSYVVSKYGMTVPELLNKADAHNLSTARKHIRYCTGIACADEVHANNEKFILLNNDRIVDGHHFLAKSEKGKVSRSLPVIDLSPIRHQAALAEWDESKHKRGQPGNAGEFGPGGGHGSSTTKSSGHEFHDTDGHITSVSNDLKFVTLGPEGKQRTVPLGTKFEPLTKPFIDVLKKSGKDPDKFMLMRGDVSDYRSVAVSMIRKSAIPTLEAAIEHRKQGSPSWRDNGNAHFAGFTQDGVGENGSKLSGEAMVGTNSDGKWVAGARTIGPRQIEKGYYKDKGDSRVFDSREDAEEEAAQLAIEVGEDSHAINEHFHNEVKYGHTSYGSPPPQKGVFKWKL